MKIKKESLTKSTKFDDENSNQKCHSDLSELESHEASFLSENVQTCHALVSVPVAKEEIISEVTIKSDDSCTDEQWHQSGILRQALLSISSSEQMEKSETSVGVESVLPKVRDNLLPVVDEIKLGDELSPVPTSVGRNTLSHGSFSPTSDFSAPLASLPSESTFSLPFAALSGGSLNSNCNVQSQDRTLSIMTPLQPCDIHQERLQSPPNVILSNSGGVVPSPDQDSSVSVSCVDSISSSLVTVGSSYSASPNLCQAFSQASSSSSKNDIVTVVYSSIPKVEPSTSNLIHNIQKTVPLPPMSAVKSSLTNHLSVLPQTDNASSENDLHGKVSNSLSSISSNTSSHSETINFGDLSSNEVNNTLNTMKLDESQSSSEFVGESVTLTSEGVKFGTDNSDITSSIVLPVSSDVILTKIDGQNSSSHQDISHIITIPLPACTIYNSSLSIPMPLTLCNGATSGAGTVQMTSAVVSSLPYSIAGISPQVSTPCWPNSSIALNVTSASNTQLSTSVTTSLPVSIMSVAPAMSSIQNNNTIHFTSNSISLPTSTQVASSSMAAIPQDPVCYTTDILSQLSKAGALPTMSSSQVSSVLSGLGSHFLDLDPDAANHSEILNTQVLPGDKVSTLTQTDSLEMNIIQHDDKIIQLLNGQQLLEHQVNGSQLLMQSTSQSDALNPDTSLNSNDLIANEINESKQIPSPFPRIVAMVLNAPVCNNKMHAQDSNVEGEVIRTSNNIVEPSHLEHPTHNSGDSLQDFLVLPNKPKQRKLSKRTSALREMLLGSVDKDPVKRPKGRSTKVKSESCLTANMSVIRIDKTRGKEDQCINLNNSLFTKEVGCYKCKCCPFLSVEEASMISHIKLKHCSEVEEMSVVRQELKCPGCPNVFFTTNSLEVHLKQDHQVSTPELKVITSSAIKVAAESKINSPPVKKKKKKANGNNSVKSIQTANASDTNPNEISPSVRPLNSSITMSTVTGTLPSSTNSNNESKLAGNDLKLTIKNLDNPSCGSKSGYNFRNIHGVSNVIRDNNSSENNGKIYEGGNVKLEGNIPDLKTTDSNIGEKVPVVEQKKKRGRPKGSKSSVLGGHKSSDKDGNRSEKTGNTGHRCNVDHCAVTMRSPENIEYHRSCHSGAEFRCPECSHTHCHWNGMSTHLWRSHMVDMELYTCDQCNYKTVSYAKLINLHKWIHGSERPFLCDSCGKGFKNRKQLRNHKTIHQPKHTKLGECEICGRTFTNTRMLRMHLDNVHNKLRPHLCNYCGYSASSVSSLKMHMRKHTGEKPFRCHLCDYCTADHNSLRRHKMRHTGYKPYKCPHCPYACIQSSTYKAHLKTKHPGMDYGLMFSCNLCSFHSVKEENYLAHMAEHRKTESKPSEEFNLEEPAESVFLSRFCHVEHLENGSNSSYSMAKLGDMDSTPDVQMALESDFEAEEITGDISEAELITGDLGEPQEFKMCENHLRIKSP